MPNTSPEVTCIASPADAPSTARLIAQIVDLSRIGLPRMFNAERQLFCNILHRDAGGQLVQEGISHRYTMMTLLGLHRLETSGSTNPIRMGPVMDALTCDLGWIEYSGDLGVLLWLCAVVDPGRIEKISAKLDFTKALVRYKDAQQRSTTELAWILAGLSPCETGRRYLLFPTSTSCRLTFTTSSRRTKAPMVFLAISQPPIHWPVV